MGLYTMDLDQVDRTMGVLVGGKGANLGELRRIGEVRVPEGFCVTTEAFVDALAGTVPLEGPAAAVRRSIEAIALPGEIAGAIVTAVERLGPDAEWAVRSSATAEDLPTASFAGLQDTYLNVRGAAEVLAHVTRCWASLFSERAVAYRARGGFDHGEVRMAVVVQHMVDPTAAGTMFTADPVNGDRKVTSIEAVLGLGEALVSGMAEVDLYTVRGDEVRDARAAREGERVLTDDQAVGLARLGRRIEAHFGRPQDIEWCLDDDGFQIVQSRPITTLFPVPTAADDRNRVYVSVGHQQMMTDPFRPLGLSFWQLTAARPMPDAGGRLFVDVTAELGSETAREGNLKLLGKSDPLIGGALEKLVERGFVPTVEEAEESDGPPSGRRAPLDLDPTIETDPAIVTGLIEQSRQANEALRREIGDRSGTALFDFIREDSTIGRERLFDPRGLQVVMAGFQASWWLNEHLGEWLGEQNVADTLARSAPGNVTAEMGLALMDTADVVRRHPEVVELLRRVGQDDGFLEALPTVAGGAEARAAIEGFLATYGMRCVGEIDITRPRWSERPGAIVPMLLSNVENFEAGAGQRRFERGREEAAEKEREVLERLRGLPDGEEKAEEARRKIERLRAFVGFREYPKYGKVSRDFIYKQALMREAAGLAAAGVIDDPEDVFYLSFDEFRETVRSRSVDHDLVGARRAEFEAFEALAPPRVLTSDGEAVTGTYRAEGAPEGALIGQGVSVGTVEGRARVVTDIAEADLRAGDILVTSYTDPSWTPLFVAIGGLVTEVGGQTTHGAVIAREYGLPAIVGVEDATRLIEDGRRIRVDGSDGFVEFLD